MANLKSRQVGSIHILTPKGYLTGGEETEELEKAIRQPGEDGNRTSSLIWRNPAPELTALGVLSFRLTRATCVAAAR